MLNNTLTIKITNNTTIPQTWHALGFNEGIRNVPGVVVSVMQSSLDQTTRQSATDPFIIEKIKIIPSSNAQLEKPVRIVYKNSEGELLQQQFVPLNYYEPINGITNMVVIPRINLEITGDVAFKGIIDAYSSMTMVVNITEKGVKSNFIDPVINFLQNLKIKLIGRLDPGTRIILK